MIIQRIGAAASAGAAAVVATVPSVPQPMLGSFLGLPFEVPNMIAAIFGCTVTRIIIGQSDRTSKWFVRVPVDILTLGTTFVVTVERRPEIFAALLTGIFVGTLGATIIKLAEKWGGKFVSVVLDNTPAAPAPPPGPRPVPPAPPLPEPNPETTT
jgi:hypothetical protein